MYEVLHGFAKKGLRAYMELQRHAQSSHQVFKQQYSVPGAAGLELKVYDARKDAKHLRCIVSSSSVATFSASASRMGQVPVDKHQKLLPYVVEQSEPDWDHRDEWCTVEAELYTYTIVDVDEKPVKSSCPFTAVLHPRPFGKGAMRFAFYLVDQGNPDSKYVGKVYQFEDPAFQQRSTYEGDMTSQAVAGYLAKEFSLQYVEDPIEFVQAQLLRISWGGMPGSRFLSSCSHPTTYSFESKDMYIDGGGAG